MIYINALFYKKSAFVVSFFKHVMPLGETDTSEVESVSLVSFVVFVVSVVSVVSIVSESQAKLSHARLS